MEQVLARSSHLTGSEGTEYDLEGELPLQQQGEKLVAKLGMHPKLMGVDPSELFTPEDLSMSTLPSPKGLPAKVSIDESFRQSGGLSQREMNRVRRKVLTYQLLVSSANKHNLCLLFHHTQETINCKKKEK